MNLLIFAAKADVHSDALVWARQQAGLPTTVVRLRDYPASLSSCFRVSTGEVGTFEAASSNSKFKLSDFDVVWNRRRGKPTLHTNLAADDRAIAEAICSEYVDGLIGISLDGQIWVNPTHSRDQVDNKLYQLWLAQRVGFEIPDTIISNQPVAIRDFVGSHKTAIVKPIAPMIWSMEETSRFLPTTKVTLDDLQNDEQLLAAPMIYQQQIAKRAEARVVVFGEELLACEIDSQSDRGSELDFRLVNPKKLNVREIKVPPTVEKTVLDFMRRAGVVHGSFDFAITKNRGWTLFEFNEQGQTLWLEECNPNIRILDRLFSFFENPSVNFRWAGREQYAFAEFETADRLAESLMARGIRARSAVKGVDAADC